MPWIDWIVFGPVATALLTSIMIAAQMSGRSRMDIPLMLGTMVTPNLDRARVVGAAMHLCIGQGFAAIYVAAFHSIGWATWWLGAAFGAIHAGIALTLLVPIVPGIHPRMASARGGPELDHVLEPPGLLGLNYGRETPIVTTLGHVVYGVLLAVFAGPS